MSNLFSIFDPTSNSFLSLNWVISCSMLIILPQMFWVMNNQMSFSIKSMMSTLNGELKMLMSVSLSYTSSLYIVSLFMFILLTNTCGLLPYVFTASSHLSFTLSLALALWVGYTIVSWVKTTSSSLAHLVPLGTPPVLMPFMVIIELVSSMIRPITLSVRLAANMVAGHLLMALLSGPISSSSFSLGTIIFLALVLLSVLELAVSVIQAYVFMTLTSLYVNEVNSPPLF